MQAMLWTIHHCNYAFALNTDESKLELYIIRA